LPVTLHDTAVFVVPVTVAVNCCLAPVFSSTETGEMLTATGGVIVITAEPDLEGSATETAVMVTCGGVGRVEGAVYVPSVVRVPHAD
jgi:hypothetical protein